MITLKTFLVVLFVMSTAKSEQKDLAFKKTAYQSFTMKSNNGFEWEAKYAVDGEEDTYSATKFKADPSWWAVDLGRHYLIGTVHMDAIVFREKKAKVDVTSFQVVLMNNFDASYKPPTALNVCWKFKGTKEQFKVLKKKVKCSVETSINGYRYLALLTPAWYRIEIVDLKVFGVVYEMPSTTTATTSTTTTSTTTSTTTFVRILTPAYEISTTSQPVVYEMPTTIYYLEAEATSTEATSTAAGVHFWLGSPLISFFIFYVLAA